MKKNLYICMMDKTRTQSRTALCDSEMQVFARINIL